MLPVHIETTAEELVIHINRHAEPEQVMSLLHELVARELASSQPPASPALVAMNAWMDSLEKIPVPALANTLINREFIYAPAEERGT
jgi:hypothetical protein